MTISNKEGTPVHGRILCWVHLQRCSGSERSLFEDFARYFITCSGSTKFTSEMPATKHQFQRIVRAGFGVGSRLAGHSLILHLPSDLPQRKVEQNPSFQVWRATRKVSRLRKTERIQANQLQQARQRESFEGISWALRLNVPWSFCGCQTEWERFPIMPSWMRDPWIRARPECHCGRNGHQQVPVPKEHDLVQRIWTSV